MANFSNYLENKIVDWLKGITMPAAPTSLFIALFSSDPTDANSGTELTDQITATANRIGVANNLWTVVAATTTLDAQIKNNAEITITSNSTNTVNKLASHFGVYNSVTGGELLFHGVLSSTVTIAPGDSVKFAINAITLTVQ